MLVARALAWPNMAALLLLAPVSMLLLLLALERIERGVQDTDWPAADDVTDLSTDGGAPAAGLRGQPRSIDDA